MKKVVIYTENYMYGGLERCLFDFVKHCKNDLFMLFNKGNERILAFAKENNVPYQTIEIKANLEFLKPQDTNKIRRTYCRIKGILNSYFNLIYNYFYLKKILFKYRNYDNIVFFNGGYPGAGSCIAGVLVAKKIGIKNIILMVLSPPFEYKNPLLKKIKRCIDKYIDKKVMKSVNKIVTNCKSISRKLIESRGFNENKITTIYTGISIPKEIGKINEIQNGRMRVGKDNDNIWIGMVGILGSTKTQAVLIMAMSIVNRYNKNVKCLIVGDGPEYKNLQNLTVKLGLSNYVFFTGRYISNLSDFYRFIDIYVFSSFHEGLPYTITEAMSYKIPIVATRVGGIPEQIEEEINGYLVDENNPEQLAEKILKMIKKRDEWTMFGEKSYEKVCSKFKLETMIENINCLLI